MVVTRAIAIFGLGKLSNWLAGSQISLPDQIVLWWGGLRGSVSIALALSVPVVLPEREKIISTVFGVVLFTLLIQGLTTKPILEKLGLLSNQKMCQQYLEAIAHRVALNQVLKRLTYVADRQEIEPEFYHHLAKRVQEQINHLQSKINQLHNRSPQLRDLTIDQLQADLLEVEVDTYAQFVRTGQLKELPKSSLQEIFKEF